MHAVTLVSHGGRGPGAHDPAETRVGSQLPAHLEFAGVDAAAAVLGQRIRGQTGPQHDPVGRGVTRGDAEGERVPGRQARVTEFTVLRATPGGPFGMSVIPGTSGIIASAVLDCRKLRRLIVPAARQLLLS